MGKVRLKARVVYEREYFADPSSYKEFGDTPQSMADCDLEGIKSDPYLFVQDIEPEVTVEVTTPHFVEICQKCQGLKEVHPMSVYFDALCPGRSFKHDKTPVYDLQNERLKDKPFCECEVK